jgi:hypothetical protein
MAGMVCEIAQELSGTPRYMILHQMIFDKIAMVEGSVKLRSIRSQLMEENFLLVKKFMNQLTL